MCDFGQRGTASREKHDGWKKACRLEKPVGPGRLAGLEKGLPVGKASLAGTASQRKLFSPPQSQCLAGELCVGLVCKELCSSCASALFLV